MISMKKMILNFMSYARGHIYTKSARTGLRDTQIIILTIMSVDSSGGSTAGSFTVLCVTVTYISWYHGCHD